MGGKRKYIERITCYVCRNLSGIRGNEVERSVCRKRRGGKKLKGKSGATSQEMSRNSMEGILPPQE